MSSAEELHSPQFAFTMKTRPTRSVFPLKPFSLLSCLMLIVDPLVMAQRSNINFKGFSGIRKFPNSLRQVYYNEQTVAVVEMGKNRELLNCELIEIYKPKEDVQVKKELSEQVSQPIPISFQQMGELMDQCQLLDSAPSSEGRAIPSPQLRPNLNLLSMISSQNYILPGTKWCGAGDVAKTYYDLGSDKMFDLCCRTHDLCPIKLQPHSTRFNITNKSFYSKSHCDCDDKLFNCLKKINHPLSDFMGNFYFNLLRIQCVEDLPQGSNCNESEDCTNSELREEIQRRFRNPKVY